MKELSIEEKAKAYDEAVINGSRLLECGEITRENCEYIFPELKESEDEKIRKWIKKELESKYVVDNIVNNVMADKALAWLEKQGEHYNFCKKIQVGDHVTRNEDGVLVNLSQLKRVAKKDEQILANSAKTCKDEQKPAWSEKYIANVFEKVGLAKIVREQSNDNLTIALQNAMIELSKFTPQPKHEWSEEDKKILKEVISNYESAYLPPVLERERILKELKSLRPQNRWKPSKSQKEALLWCVVHLGGADKQTLGELLEELNKL